MEFLRTGVSGKTLTCAVASIALALILFVLMAIWQLVQGLHVLGNDLLLDEIQKVRSQAVHTVGRIEQVLESDRAADLRRFGTERVGDSFLSPTPTDDGRYVYAAVVDADSTVIWHTQRNQEGKQLKREWYDSVAYGLGPDVVRTHSTVLGQGLPVYDVHVPIFVGGLDVGSYHIGLSQRWLDQWSAEARSEYRLLRFLWIGLVIALAAVAGTALYLLSRQILVLQKAVTETYLRAASELGRLAAGLAHEIRNPLHALRLNVHAFRRTQQDQGALEPAEITRMLDESAREIDRVDKLLQQLINFASPAEPRVEAFNLNVELAGVVDFLGEELRRGNIEIRLVVPRGPVNVRMDPARLRQIMLNLLHNARDAMPDGGRIDVELTRRDTHAEIVVADEGTGIADSDLPHIFEPFFTTSDDGTGLGLALVKRFVEEMGGEIACEVNQPHGMRFRVRLQEVGTRVQGGACA